jgi:hypothetical protein
MAVVRGLSGLALLALVASCRGNGDAASAAAHLRVATVHGTGGKVELLRGNSADWIGLGDGALLYEDDRMRTFKGAWAQLVFDGGSTLRVAEESLIGFGGGITVERGSVEGELAAGLRLRTPTAEAETVTSRDIQFR